MEIVTAKKEDLEIIRKITRSTIKSIYPRYYPDVIGLDIVNDALEANRMRAIAEEIKNLSFVSYDGIDFPFESGSFDLVVTRYALHHFPDIVHSIGEVSRVLKNGGMLFISDPCPNECDTDRFVDDYMRLKKDGHIKFYTKDDWTDICCNQGLIILDSFESSTEVHWTRPPGLPHRLRFPGDSPTSMPEALRSLKCVDLLMAKNNGKYVVENDIEYDF